MHKDLYSFRKDNGITQKQAADILGLSTTSYSKKERGKVSFTLDEASTLSKGLKTDMFKLFPEYFFVSTVPKMHKNKIKE